MPEIYDDATGMPSLLLSKPRIEGVGHFSSGASVVATICDSTPLHQQLLLNPEFCSAKGLLRIVSSFGEWGHLEGLHWTKSLFHFDL